LEERGEKGEEGGGWGRRGRTGPRKGVKKSRRDVVRARCFVTGILRYGSPDFVRGEEGGKGGGALCKGDFRRDPSEERVRLGVERRGEECSILNWG
jgi:hypothetical protein